MIESHNTTGPIRSESIYVSWKIRKSLGYLAQALGTTREALAESILNEWLSANHPSIGEYLDKRQAEEKEFMTKFKPTTPPPPKPKPTTPQPRPDGKPTLHEKELVP